MDGTIYRFQNRVIKKEKKRQNQFVALDVDSVAPRHTMVYVWERLEVCFPMQSQCITILDGAQYCQFI